MITNMNLIPELPSKSMAYWCSWHTQNIVALMDLDSKFPPEIATAMKEGAAGAKGARMMLNEELIFGTGGYAHQYDKVRGDLYLMLDDGWDVDYGINPDTQMFRFGSLELSEERFPSTKGLSPAERMKVINHRVKALGWKGIGIWIAAQRSAEDYDSPFSEKDLPYWKERILWCREAGVEYWKVDWGTQAANSDFRRALTDLGHTLYPDLIIEHAVCMGPLNGFNHPDPAKRGRYAGEEWCVALAKEVSSYSDVFRSYDVLNATAIPTTLDRLATLLPMAKGYVNGEDECYINAALGCPCGVMRSACCLDRVLDDGDTRGQRLDEVTAALRWQHIAPPFIGTEISCSEEVLMDRRFFDFGSTWCGSVFGQTVEQGAPAVIARNLSAQSIRVTGDVKPYVVASLHPNGAYSVGILPRIIDGVCGYPEATVVCDIPDGVDTIGVLGVGCDLCLHLPEAPSRVYVQSLLSDEAIELTADADMRSALDGHTLTINKELAASIFGETDMTAPALVIRIQ